MTDDPEGVRPHGHPPGSPLGWRPGTAAKRAQILDAATAVFGEKGYVHGTLADVADRVGLTRAGVLHHFGSKDRLLMAVLRHRDEGDVERLAEKHLPGGSELFRHLVATAVANESRPGLVQAYVVLSAESVTADHPARTYFEERYASLRTILGESLSGLCAERGITDPVVVERASASMLAVMDGMQTQWLLAPDSVDLAETTAWAIEAIVRAVLDPDDSVPGDGAPG